jgi:hypothetical protein
VVLLGRAWWTEVVNFAALARHGMVDAADLALFRLVDEPEEG